MRTNQFNRQLARQKIATVFLENSKLCSRLFCIIVLFSSPALAGKDDNIAACIQMVEQRAKVTLKASDAAYEGNWVKASVVRWDRVRCEVKLGEIITMTVDGKYVAFNGFPSVDVYELNGRLEADAERAIDELKLRIADIEQHMEKATVTLRQFGADSVSVEKEMKQRIQENLGSGAKRNKTPPSTRTPVRGNAADKSTGIMQSGPSEKRQSNVIKEKRPEAEKSPKSGAVRVPTYAECVKKGVAYYKEIDSYPYLSTGEDADSKLRGMCARSGLAFGR